MTQELLDKANDLIKAIALTQKRYDTLLFAVSGARDVTISIQVEEQIVVIPYARFTESVRKFMGEYRNEVLNDLTALQDELKNL